LAKGKKPSSMETMPGIYKDLSQYDSSLFWLDKFTAIAEEIANQGFLGVWRKFERGLISS
jgi:hypothetical protein